METGNRPVSGSALLKLLTKRISRKKYLGHVVDLFREWSDCRCVGIRVLNEDGTIPYEAYTGFSDDFRKSENWLSIKEAQCACIRVITAKPEPQDISFMTPFGSFLNDNVGAFIRGLNEKGKARYRGVCVKHGFMSLAIIPIRYGPAVIAAIHIADEKEGMLPIEKITAFELLTPIIGEAIQRFGIEDKLKKHYVMQRVVNSLLHMSLNNSNLEEILSQALEKVFSMPWLPLEQKGCIFLVKDRPGVLECTVHKGISQAQLQQCTEVSFVKCFCGKATSERAPVFSQQPRHNHEEELSHRHYCLPLFSSDRVLGVVNFYLKEEQQLNPQHKEFLSSIANVLASIIIRKEAEEKLKNSSEQLRRLAAHLQSSREDERTEFAREVHDELGQALTALKMDIFWIRNRLSEDETALIAKAEDSLALVDSTIKSVRRICTELRPDILDHLGITAAVEWQIEEFRKRTGIKCIVLIHPREMKISRDLSISVFRIMQEALTNIIRHSGATEVIVTMESAKNFFSFRISDNGKGIAKKNIHGSKSFGILGIRERVRFWNGNLHIEGRPSKGTTLLITIPLSKSIDL